MRTKKSSNWFTFVMSPVFATGLFCVAVTAQTPAPSPELRKPEPRKIVAETTVSPVILENRVPAPQVVTILHSLNGLKVFRLLISQEQVEAIAQLDQAFKISGEVHTNVIAGLALDDGHTIAAWLPEAEAEMPPPAVHFAPRAPLPPKASATTGPAAMPPPNPPGMTPMAIPGVPAITLPGNLLEPADLRVITRDGKRIMGRYVGLDGLTGLSLITLMNGSLPESVEPEEETINIGEKLRVIGPQPAPRAEAGTKTAMYVRIGETNVMVTDVSRSPSGSIARVKIRSAKLSPTNIGGIAINERGETLGIVDAVEGAEATIVPVALVRMAAKRVLARQASVPRPWLGIRGEPIGAVSLERILRVGWQLERARELAERRQGILLTSVAPGSPAALAKLKPGDVILSVNNGYVRNADDFSWLLDEAGPEIPVRFNVARPGKEYSEALEIKLSESPDPLFGLPAFEKYIEKAFQPGSLRAEGVETVALKPRVAVRFGSTGGLLVVSVRPSTDAFKAGLRPGDVIESIDGQPALSGAAAITPKAPGENSTCVIVRNKEKVVLTLRYSTTNQYSTKP
jgi:S1-C subfamily serine protease